MNNINRCITTTVPSVVKGNAKYSVCTVVCDEIKTHHGRSERDHTNCSGGVLSCHVCRLGVVVERARCSALSSAVWWLFESI